MKLKTNFFHVARMMLLMSAPVLILGTPGVAATAVHSTAVVTSPSTTDPQIEELPILVNNYVAMLQSLAAQNEDQEFYDIYSMTEQISVAIDFQGNRTYQVVEGKDEEVMQGLNANEKNRYHSWLNDQLEESKESRCTVASTDKAGSIAAKSPADAATPLLFTPDQVDKIKNGSGTLGKLTHNRLENNIFDQQAIVAAIVAYLVSLGLGASANTINTAANISKYAAVAFLTLAGVPILAEFAAHGAEGLSRSSYAKVSEQNECQVRALIAREAKNAELAEASKRMKMEGSASVPMVYAYKSRIGETLGTFATNWRNTFGPVLNMMSFGLYNPTTDELHVSLDGMNDVAAQLATLQAHQDRVKKAMSDLPDHAATAIGRQAAATSAPEEAVLLGAKKATLESLQAAKQSCLAKVVQWTGGKISSLLCAPVQWADDKWEAFQMSMRNAGYEPAPIVPDHESGTSFQDFNSSRTPEQGGGMESYNYGATSSRRNDDFGGSGRDPHTMTESQRDAYIAEMAGRPAYLIHESGKGAAERKIW